MRLPKKNILNESEELTMKDTRSELACDLNYEAEYNRLKEEFEKMKAERERLSG